MSRKLPLFITNLSDMEEKKPGVKKPGVKKPGEIIIDDSDDDLEFDEENPSGCTVVKIYKKCGKVNYDVYIGDRCMIGGIFKRVNGTILSKMIVFTSLLMIFISIFEEVDVWVDTT